jgi:hypothetical protein
MSIEDFFDNFNDLGVCKVEAWNEIRLKGKFIKVKEAENENWDWALSKFYYTFKLNEEGRVNIGVHQEDERVYGVKQTRPYLDTGFALMKQEDEDELVFVDF